MGLQNISVQLVLYPNKTGEYHDQFFEVFDTSKFHIELISANQINYIELIALKSTDGSDMDENILKERFLEMTTFLHDLPNPIRKYIQNNDCHILFGGWSPNDDQITNLIIPSEFSLQTSLLNLNYEFCFNDYHM